MHQKTGEIQEYEFAVSFKRFPPDFSKFAALGFDRVAASKSEVLLNKTYGTDLSGKSKLFIEVRLSKNKARLRFSCPAGAHPQLRRMQAAILFLRILSLIEGAWLEREFFQKLALPALETAEKTAQAPYELLAKRAKDLEEEASALSLRNRRLISASEEAESQIAALENRIAILEERLARLSSISDESLRELLLEWICSHKGSFNIAAFSKTYNLPPSRCEEGLEMLLMEGSIRKIEGKLFPSKSSPQRLFSTHAEGAGGFSKALSCLFAFKMPFSQKENQDNAKAGKR
ncbi:MAG: hypothetical protein N3E51_00520 [Candidatus Micrarchaeota archaeon]|nr:hypothetical protein [Candidatus Micrarchaeota archaeon]